MGFARHWLKAQGARNAIFIWVPKTAGMSIFHTLKPHGCYRIKSPSGVRWTFPGRGFVTFKRQDYGELLREGYVSSEFDASAYKFGFVRNPYDRAVSLYFFLRKKSYFPPDVSFLDFWRQIDANPPQSVGAHKLVGLGITAPQMHWLRGFETHRLGRFERLNESFAEILSDLGLPPADLPWRNPTSHKHFSDYYCDESKAIIDRRFAEDFDELDYGRELPQPAAASTAMRESLPAA